MVKSAVVGLVGTAPVWAVQAPAVASAVNAPALVSSALGAASFGPAVRGYTIPYALAAIQAQGAGQVIVVNVFNPAIHQTVIAPGAFTMPTAGLPQVVSVGHMGLVGPGLAGFTGATTVTVKNAGGTVTYAEGTDYTVDYVNGLIAAKQGGAITAGESLTIGFAYCDPAKVQDSDVIGAVTGGAYTGLQALQTTYGTMGFFAKILIAPGFSQNADVAGALDAMAQKIRAITLVDAPPSTPVATAIANRGVAGNAFDTSSKRTVLCYPQETFYDTGIVPTGVTLNSAGAPVPTQFNANAVGPYSQWVAGAIAARDLARGYWWSPSNMQVEELLGPDVPLYASAVDSSCDVNTLNASGILTVFNAFGTGLRVWGNRSAAYPAITAPDNFVSVRRTMDVIEESVELAMLQFIDQPISNALITAILASVNAFLRTLIQRGALVAGSASYDPAKNPPTQVAAGQLVFGIDVIPPPPAERLTFETFIDVTLLQQLGQTAAAAATA